MPALSKRYSIVYTNLNVDLNRSSNPVTPLLLLITSPERGFPGLNAILAWTDSS